MFDGGEHCVPLAGPRRVVAAHVPGHIVAELGAGDARHLHRIGAAFDGAAGRQRRKVEGRGGEAQCHLLNLHGGPQLNEKPGPGAAVPPVAGAGSDAPWLVWGRGGVAPLSPENVLPSRMRSTSVGALAPSVGSRIDRKSTRLTPVTNAHLVCRLLLEK